MVTFYLLRHAQKQKLPGDIGLTELGKKHARLTGNYLKKKNLHHFYTSPLKRAADTAAIVNETLHVPLTIDARLKERMNWGDIEGQTYQDFWRDWERTDNDRDLQLSYGDSARKTGKRFRSLTDELSNTNNYGKSILFITHGGAIGDFLLDVFTIEDLKKVKPDLVRVKWFDIECSLTIIKSEKNTYTIEQFGSIAHLNSSAFL